MPLGRPRPGRPRLSRTPDPKGTTVTPAAELTAAADLLEPLADAAQHDLDTADYWKPYDKATAWRDGHVNGFGGVSSELVAILPPAACKELARWLRSAARDAREIGPDPHALAVARAVLGTPDGQP